MKENNSLQSGRWSQDEHRLFLEGLELYGRNWKQLQKMVPQRSASQIRSHAQKYFQKLNKSDQQATLMHSADISQQEPPRSRQRREMEDFLEGYQRAKKIEEQLVRQRITQSFFLALAPGSQGFIREHVDLDIKKSDDISGSPHSKQQLPPSQHWVRKSAPSN